MRQNFRFNYIEIAAINSYFTLQIDKRNAMNSRFFILNLLISAFVVSVSLYSQGDSTEIQIEYSCPMNCSDYTSPEPGRCPVCGMDLKPKELKEHPDKEKTITSEELNILLDSEEDVLLLDVRSEHEFNGDVNPIEGAILIPISELENRINELEEFRNLKIIVHCLRGIRSEIGTKILTQHGYYAYNLEGGLIAWYGENN